MPESDHNCSVKTGEIAHWLRVLAALMEDLSWNPSAHAAAYNYL